MKRADKTRATRRFQALAPLGVCVALAGYPGCMPDFDALNQGSPAGAGGSGASSGGARVSGGTSSTTGGSEPCPGEQACSGGTSTGGSGTGGAAGGSVGGQGGDGGEPAAGQSGIGGAAGQAGDGAGGERGGEGGVGPAGGSAGEPSGVSGAAGVGNGGGAVVHFDFERTYLEGWQPVSQRPERMIDEVVQTTEAAHHGTGSLVMRFDGAHDALAGTAYYGVYTNMGAPPANAEVSLWMMSTADLVTVDVYRQAKPDYAWVALKTRVTLPQGVWTQIQFTNDLDLFYLGVLVNSPLEMVGSVYLDDISW